MPTKRQSGQDKKQAVEEYITLDEGKSVPVTYASDDTKCVPWSDETDSDKRCWQDRLAIYDNILDEMKHYVVR